MQKKVNINAGGPSNVKPDKLIAQPVSGGANPSGFANKGNAAKSGPTPGMKQASKSQGPNVSLMTSDLPMSTGDTMKPVPGRGPSAFPSGGKVLPTIPSSGGRMAGG